MHQHREAPSLSKSRITGVLFIVLGLGLAYVTVVRPLQEAARTGELRYLVKGVLMPPGLIYLGLCVLFADLRDGQIRTVAPDGTSKFTPKAKVFLAGLMVVLGLSWVAWEWYLHLLGYVLQT